MVAVIDFGLCIGGWLVQLTQRMGGLWFCTVAAFIRGNHLTAGRAPVVANFVSLAKTIIFVGPPIRQELAFWIRRAFGLASIKSRLLDPQRPCVPLVFLDKAQRIGFAGFDQLETA